jgi:hypothetical protein
MSSMVTEANIPQFTDTIKHQQKKLDCLSKAFDRLIINGNHKFKWTHSDATLDEQCTGHERNLTQGIPVQKNWIVGHAKIIERKIPMWLPWQLFGISDSTGHWNELSSIYTKRLTTRLLERNALPRKGIFHVTRLILPYLEHNAYLHKIVYSYSWANRCRSRWDTTDAAAKSVHSGESPLHHNVDSFCASEIVT